MLSQDQSCGALLGDYLQPVAPAGFVFFSSFSSCSPDYIPEVRGEAAAVSPGTLTDPAAGVRVRGCLPVAALRLSIANLPQGLQGRSTGAHHQAHVVAPSCSMAKTVTEAFE